MDLKCYYVSAGYFKPRGFLSSTTFTYRAVGTSNGRELSDHRRGYGKVPPGCSEGEGYVFTELLIYFQNMYTLCNNFNIFNILYRISIQLLARVLDSVLKFSSLFQNSDFSSYGLAC